MQRLHITCNSVNSQVNCVFLSDEFLIFYVKRRRWGHLYYSDQRINNLKAEYLEYTSNIQQSKCISFQMLTRQGLLSVFPCYLILQPLTWFISKNVHANCINNESNDFQINVVGVDAKVVLSKVISYIYIYIYINLDNVLLFTTNCLLCHCQQHISNLFISNAFNSNIVCVFL